MRNFHVLIPDSVLLLSFEHINMVIYHNVNDGYAESRILARNTITGIDSINITLGRVSIDK